MSRNLAYLHRFAFRKSSSFTSPLHRIENSTTTVYRMNSSDKDVYTHLDQSPIEQNTTNSTGKLTQHAAAKRRSRPPLRYTEDFQTPSTVQLNVIGVVRSPYKERFGTPRQPVVTENTLGNKQQPARIELYEGSRFELGLRGLADFEYCWVISFFHLNQGFNPLITPPRGPRKKQGVFATRSPHRPNSVGLSCIRITGVDEKKGIIHLLGVDLLDGTAVLDIKPYVPYCDAFPDAKAGWLDTLKEDMKAPDALGYYPPPAHLMRPLTPPGENATSTGEVDTASRDENCQREAKGTSESE